ncbi:hypothetical protein [Streptomyces sp. NPDC056660]|uniref:hypothetical protein n=1 Tax=Streptomyces sp. NPDC056660 TaxID=3345897 RepID=UPI0036B7EBC0
MDHALGYVCDAWSEDPAGRGVDGRDEEDVIVLISRRRAPMWRVVQGLQEALDEI